MYNGEKVCKITYGSWQGKRLLIKKFKNTKVWKSANQNIKPFVLNTLKINEKEIEQILQRYRRKRQKERELVNPKKDVEEKKQDEQNSNENKEEIKVQIQTQASAPEISQSHPPQREYSLPKQDNDMKITDKVPKFSSVFIKRNSQKPSSENKKLDEKEQGKRPASDDDKGVSSEEDKPSSKPEYSNYIKPIKLNLKKICQTSRGNF